MKSRWWQVTSTMYSFISFQKTHNTNVIHICLSISNSFVSLGPSLGNNENTLKVIISRGSTSTYTRPTIDELFNVTLTLFQVLSKKKNEIMYKNGFIMKI